MIKSRKAKLAALSLTVAAGLAVIPAVHGMAAEDRTAAEDRATTAKAGPAACQALGTDLLDTVTNLQTGLLALPPDVAQITEPVNGLLDTALGLIDLGCLPALELPAAGLPDPGLPIPGLPGQGEQLPLPLPSLPIDPPVDPGLPDLPDLPIGDLLPTVPVCTDLTADLLDAVTGVLAAVLSTGLPDLTAALDAVTELLDTITGLLSPDAACLPAADAL